MGAKKMREPVASPAALNGNRRLEPPAPALMEEADAINEAAITAPLLSTSLVLAAWRGQEARVSELAAASIEDATADGEGRAIALAEYARAVLYNGLGRYQAAVAAAGPALEHEDRGLSAWTLTELVEAGGPARHPEFGPAPPPAPPGRKGARPAGRGPGRPA